MIEGLFRWTGTTSVGAFMRDSTWGFAVVETIHLLALAILGGAVIAINLSAARWLFRRNDAAVIARAGFPFLVGALATMIVSGALLVSSKPVRYYLDDTFRAKMALLVLALAATLIVQRLLSQQTGTAWARRGAATAALLLWLSVGICGRLIGFL